MMKMYIFLTIGIYFNIEVESPEIFWNEYELEQMLVAENFRFSVYVNKCCSRLQLKTNQTSSRSYFRSSWCQVLIQHIIIRYRGLSKFMRLKYFRLFLPCGKMSRSKCHVEKMLWKNVTSYVCMLECYFECFVVLLLLVRKRHNRNKNRWQSLSIGRIKLKMGLA